MMPYNLFLTEERTMLFLMFFYRVDDLLVKSFMVDLHGFVMDHILFS